MTVKVYLNIKRVGNIIHKVYHIEIYEPTTSATGYANISGNEELQQVVGPNKDNLFEEGRIVDLFEHICKDRTSVVRGSWNNETEEYELNERDLTVNFQRARLNQLIDQRAERGIKLLRKAIKINNSVFQITVFGILCSGDGVGPSLRFITYNPATSDKSVLIVHGKTIEGIIQGREYLLEEQNRVKLCEELCSKLKLCGQELVLPGMKEAEVTITPNSSQLNNSLSVEHKDKRKSLLRTSFCLPDEESKRVYNCVISIYEGAGTKYLLLVDIYIPLRAESCNLKITPSEVHHILGQELSLKPCESLRAGLMSLMKFIVLRILYGDTGETSEPKLSAKLLKNPPVKEWYVAYKKLNTRKNS